MRLGRSAWRIIAFVLALGLIGAGVILAADPIFLTRGAAQAQENDEEEGAAPPPTGTAGKVPSAAAAAAAAAQGSEEKECPAGKVRVNFTDTDIRDIVKTMAAMTNRNFLLDKSISGTITIISPVCISPAEAYDVFLSVLYVNGLTTVQVGELTKIVKRAEAQSQPIPTLTEGLGRANENYITQLIPLKNIDAMEIANAFRPLISPDGNFFAYGPNNMLILMDSGANINRIYQILQKLDVEGTEELVEVIPIEYASADSLAEVIMQLFEDETATAFGLGGRSSAYSQLGGAGAQNRVSRLRERLRSRMPGTPGAPGTAGKTAATGIGGGGTFSESIAATGTLRIIPDMRTNSLVVKANKFALKRIREVVAKLDAPLPGGEGKIHVVYLENANAEDLAGVLADLAGTGGTGGAGRTGAAYGRGTSRATTSRGTSRAGSAADAFASRFGGGSAGGLSTTGAGGLQRGAMAGGGTNPTHGVASTTGRFLADFDGAVRITSDPATNSLVIIASNRDFEILKEVIAKLDIPRPQVFVEVMIAEISVERGLDIGFEFRSTNNPGEEGVQVIGGTNYGGIQQAAANPLGITGFAVGAADGTLTIGGETFPNIGALFRAMQTDRDVNIMATPHILTTDNEEAEIIIANNIPFITGQIYSQNFNNPTTTIERKDVGITLRITPQINESDMVRLIIYQESSTVTDSPQGLSAAQVGITTAKRSADTVVVVKSRQTVIIGGLMQDNITYSEAKVPVFGDIPLLGYLFKSSHKSVQKTNLLIFITPYIIKDNGDLEEVTRQSNFRLQRFREQNRIERRTDQTNENQMIPTERVFRRQDPNAIEIDRSKTGTGVQPPPPPPDDQNKEDQGEDQPKDNQDRDGEKKEGGEDKDFGGGGGQ